MTEYMHLIGAEDVRRAAGTMQSAAEDMKLAMDTSDSIYQLRPLKSEFVSELQQIVERFEKAADKVAGAAKS